ARRQLGEVGREDAVLGELEPETLVVAPRALDQLDVVEVMRDKAPHGRVVAVELVPRCDLRGVQVVMDEHLVGNLELEIFGPLAHASAPGLAYGPEGRYHAWTNH